MSGIRVEQQLTQTQIDDIHKWAPTAANENEDALLTQLQKDGISQPSNSLPVRDYMDALESLRKNSANPTPAVNQRVTHAERRLGIPNQDSHAIWASVEENRFVPNVIDGPGAHMRKR